MPDEDDKSGHRTLHAVYQRWLEKLRGVAEQNPLLAKVVEGAIVVPMLGLGFDGIVKFNMINVMIGFAIGLPAAYTWFGREEPRLLLGGCVAIPLIVFGSFENVIMPLVEQREPEWTSALVESCIGATLALVAGYLTSRASSRDRRLYCCGAFLGPVVCYHFVIERFHLMIGPFIPFGGNGSEQGYLIAMLVGFALSAEMPLLHLLHGRPGASAVEPAPANADQTASPVLVMTPLTFPVGLIMGFGTMLLLLGLRLMLLWPAGFVVATVLFAITWYALRLR